MRTLTHAPRLAHNLVSDSSSHIRMQVLTMCADLLYIRTYVRMYVSRCSLLSLNTVTVATVTQGCVHTYIANTYICNMCVCTYVHTYIANTYICNMYICMYVRTHLHC